MLESALESSMRLYSRACGGKAYKFISPGNPGVPDRVCVFPGGRVIFVELKRPDGKGRYSQQQLKEIARLRGLGVPVWQISDLKTFKQKLHDIGIHP